MIIRLKRHGKTAYQVFTGKRGRLRGAVAKAILTDGVRWTTSRAFPKMYRTRKAAIRSLLK